jgi:uncharacterized protein (DUF302 family)
MTTIDYHLSKRITSSFAGAIEKVTEELKKEGFGIITTIDLKETFKKKINKEFRNYVILGACNPNFAYETILAEDKVGVFLPCSVVVQEHEDGGVEVSIVNPEELMHSVDDLNLKMFATDVKEAMQNVLNRL